MDSSLVLNSEELTALIGAVLSFDSTVIKAVLKVTEIYKVASSFEDSTARSPVILVLDKVLHEYKKVYSIVYCYFSQALVSVPWESLPIMEEQLVSRIPCMHLIPHLLKIWHKKRLIHHRRLFYLLNPGGDLPETQKRLEGWFQQ